MKIRISFIATIFALLHLSSPAKQPNILFIFSDDHATEAISAYGGRYQKDAPTPNIDRIAKRGLVFENSFCGNSICGPSRATILTGKHSYLNGFTDNQHSRFDGSQPTFPKMLQEAGYETALIGKWHLKSDPTGFNHYEILPGQGSYYNPDFIQMDGSLKRFEGYVTDIIADKSIEWIKNRKDKSKPFILMSQQKAPHRAWMPAVRHMTLWDDRDLPEPDSLFDRYENRIKALQEQEMEIAKHLQWEYDLLLPGESQDPRVPSDFRSKEIKRMNPKQKAAFEKAFGPKNQFLIDNIGKMNDEELTRWKYQRYIKNYLRTIRALDENIGKMLDYLEESGEIENTIVIYSSDQGFYLGEHGWYDKRWMFEESLKMPFLIQGPGVKAKGKVSKALIQNIDYAPTFLNLAKAKVPADMQGTSIVPVLNQGGKIPSDWRSAIYYQYAGYGEHEVAPHDGVRSLRYKIMYFPRTKEWMLFDLKKDPKEMVNLAGDPKHADTLAKMKKLYDETRAGFDLNRSTNPKHRKDESRGWKQRWEQKYKEANEKPTQEAKLVFIGDSITQAWRRPGKKSWDKHFAPLGAVNWGYGGDRTEHLIWRLQNGDIQRLSPEVAVMLIGTNNTGHGMQPAPETAMGIKRCLDDLAWKWPNTKIILMSVFPRGEKPDDKMRKRNEEINTLIKKYADGERIHLLDINDQLVNQDGTISAEIMPDFLHLSPKAYEIWAKALSPKIKSLLSK